MSSDREVYDRHIRPHVTTLIKIIQVEDVMPYLVRDRVIPISSQQKVERKLNNEGPKLAAQMLLMDEFPRLNGYYQPFIESLFEHRPDIVKLIDESSYNNLSGMTTAENELTEPSILNPPQPANQRQQQPWTPHTPEDSNPLPSQPVQNIQNVLCEPLTHTQDQSTSMSSRDVQPCPNVQVKIECQNVQIGNNGQINIGTALGTAEDSDVEDSIQYNIIDESVNQTDPEPVAVQDQLVASSPGQEAAGSQSNMIHENTVPISQNDVAPQPAAIVSVAQYISNNQLQYQQNVETQSPTGSVASVYHQNVHYSQCGESRPTRDETECMLKKQAETEPKTADTDIEALCIHRPPNDLDVTGPLGVQHPPSQPNMLLSRSTNSLEGTPDMEYKSHILSYTHKTCQNHVPTGPKPTGSVTSYTKPTSIVKQQKDMTWRHPLPPEKFSGVTVPSDYQQNVEHHPQQPECELTPEEKERELAETKPKELHTRDTDIEGLCNYRPPDVHHTLWQPKVMVSSSANDVGPHQSSRFYRGNDNNASPQLNMLSNLCVENLAHTGLQGRGDALSGTSQDLYIPAKLKRNNQCSLQDNPTGHLPDLGILCPSLLRNMSERSSANSEISGSGNQMTRLNVPNQPPLISPLATDGMQQDEDIEFGTNDNNADELETQHSNVVMNVALSVIVGSLLVHRFLSNS